MCTLGQQQGTIYAILVQSTGTTDRANLVVLIPTWAEEDVNYG
jgi:hypothetical protein